jgi:bacteriocin-like protein
MTKKSIETPKAKPDDLLKPKSKGGKTEMTELSDEKIELTEEELNAVSGGISEDVKTGGNPAKPGRA